MRCLSCHLQAAEHQSKMAELEETVDCITKQKATVEENHAKEVEALKKSVKEAEESVRSKSIANGSSGHAIAEDCKQATLHVAI